MADDGNHGIALIDRTLPDIRVGMRVLIGQNFQLERIWTEDYRETGTFHALVISGTHVAILAAFFLFFLRICFVPQSLALFFTVLAAWLYALVTGWHGQRWADLPGGVRGRRQYGRLLLAAATAATAGAAESEDAEGAGGRE